MWKDPITAQWSGPDPVLIWDRGDACTYDIKEGAAHWLPERLVKQINSNNVSRENTDPEIVPMILL